MSENMKQYIADTLKNEMCMILGCKADEYDMDSLARGAVAEIDWNDSTLMHKDMKWIAAYYLQTKKIA